MTRNRAKFLVVAAATVFAVYLSTRLTLPFLPALVWATTAAVIAQPIVGLLDRRISGRPIVAAIATGLAAIILFVPAIGLVYFVATEIAHVLQRSPGPSEYAVIVQQKIEGIPYMGAATQRHLARFDLLPTFERLTEQLSTIATNVVAGFLYTSLQSLLALFVLFYLIRDQEALMATLRRVSPLTNRETNQLLNRLSDTIHATIMGTVVVALLQGALGALIFWLLGLPMPALWGLTMGLLAIVPYLGAFVIWAPAAAYLVVQGEFWQAAVLVAWGSVAIGLIDNLVYPVLVGNRLHQHTVVAFIGIVGGVAVFGGVGLVLGPIIISTTLFLIELWRRRTEKSEMAIAA